MVCLERTDFTALAGTYRLELLDSLLSDLELLDCGKLTELEKLELLELLPFLSS